MVEARVERRLAAILAADVAGYSRLMGVDEEGTLAELKEERAKVFDPKIAEHRGRIVKTTGDGALVEFASAVDAVRCAWKSSMPCASETPPFPKIAGSSSALASMSVTSSSMRTTSMATGSMLLPDSRRWPVPARLSFPTMSSTIKGKVKLDVTTWASSNSRTSRNRFAPLA